MIVKLPCLKCNWVFFKNHKAVQCNICDKWVHIPCNNLNTYTYKKLQKDKSPCHCICCLQKELPYCSICSNVLNCFMHGNRIFSPNPKFISSGMKQNELFDQEYLHHLKLYSLISNSKIKPKIIVVSENRLRGKQQIANISLTNYVYGHTLTESSNEGTLLYLDKNFSLFR